MREGLLEHIKGNGYWRINMRPTIKVPKKISLKECTEAVNNNNVSLRGWSYPHIQRNKEHGDHEYCGEYVQNWCSWQQHIEFWRMYRSKQFLHYRALWEDHTEAEPHKPRPNGTVLSVTSTIYTITEIVEFCSRLHGAGFYAGGVSLSISLENTANRQLWISNPERGAFYDVKRTQAPKIVIERRLFDDEFVDAPIERSNSILLELFDQFGWMPDRLQIRADQDRLIKKDF